MEKGRGLGFFFLVLVMFTSVCSASPRRLLLIGGGSPPREAIRRFVAWAGGESARVLVVTWATDFPESSYEGVRELLLEEGAGGTEATPPAGEMANESAQREYLEKLGRATAVFFVGGDQVRLMRSFSERALEATRIAHASGIPMGGTSAGTAIMSRVMITGEGDFSVIHGPAVETAEGLGLLENVIVDQHFVKRSRYNRLFGLVLQHRSQAGLGIDESTAAAVEETVDGIVGEVIGEGPVIVVREAKPARGLSVEILRAGTEINLTTGASAPAVRK